MILLTKNDFYRFAPVDISYDWKVAKNNIEDVEYWLFDMTTSLSDYKKILIEDQNENYNIDSFQFNPRQQYAKDEVVFYDENLYRWNLEGLSNAEPPSDGWIVLNKFNTESNNIMWTKVGKLLSLKLLMSTISFTTMRAGSKGLVIHTEDSSNMRGANRNELIEYKRELQSNIDILLGRVIKEITKSSTPCKNENIETSIYRRKIMM